MLEFRQRFPDGDLADAQLGGELPLHQSLSGLQVPPEDRLTNAGSYVAP